MTIEEVLKQIDKADNSFSNVIDEAQKRMLKEVTLLTKELTVKNGRIESSVQNLKLISQIKSKLNKAVVNKDYLKGVKELLSSFNDIQSTQIGYFQDITKGFTADKKYELLKQISVENTAAQLTESGIDANVTSKLKDMLTRSVTSGGMYADLLNEVTNFLSDNQNGVGALNRYAKTYTTTALNQFAGQTNKLMIEDSSFEWYRYVGSNIETTREFCTLMTEKDYVHKSEFEEILKGHIDGEKCEIYDKTKLPKGMIDGTNEDNLVVNRGGWGCRHQMYAVETLSVPKNLRDKIDKKII